MINREDPEDPGGEVRQCWYCGKMAAAEHGDTFDGWTMRKVDNDPGDPEVGPDPDIIDVCVCPTCSHKLEVDKYCVGTRYFQLLQWKYAVKLEAKGIKPARRSVRKHAAVTLGMSPRAKHEDVIERIERILEDILKIRRNILSFPPDPYHGKH